jgi:uncharacterized protein (TIGR00297 family)
VGILISFVLLTPAPEHRPTGTFARVFPLVAVFALSFIATRFRRTQKESEGLAEARRGRQASQIVANLGAAALFAACGSHLASIAALAEAAADTASSEVGQALGGSVRLLTTWKPVPAGTDGGITLKGTLAGFTSGGIVILVASASHPIWRQAIAVWLAACAGLFFDSLLGATVERKGWFGNDLVNFSSTIFAGLVAAIFS